MSIDDTLQILGQLDNEAAVNQSKLWWSLQDYEVEVEEVSVSWGGGERKEKEKKSKVVFDIDSEISSLFLPTDFHVVLCVGCMT